MKPILAALAAALAFAPAAHAADVTLRCDFPGWAENFTIYVITGNTAYTDDLDHTSTPAHWHVEETPTQFKLTLTEESAAIFTKPGRIEINPTIIDRVTGKITTSNRLVPFQPIIVTGQCTPVT